MGESISYENWMKEREEKDHSATKVAAIGFNYLYGGFIVKKPLENFQVSEIQISRGSMVPLKIRPNHKPRNFILQKIHTFFAKIDALNIEYISRRW